MNIQIIEDLDKLILNQKSLNNFQIKLISLEET